MLRVVPGVQRGAVATLLALVLVACQGAPAAIRADTQEYLKRMSEWAPIEQETARAIDRILATQFVDEAEVTRQIAENRPRVQAHLERARGYAPHTKDLQHVHAAYVTAWERILGAYDAILEGFSSGDYTKLARGREGILAWREGIMQVARDLRDLRDRTQPDEEPARPA